MTKETQQYKGDPRKFLVVGGGAREYVLARKLKESPRVGKLYIAPGNGGTEKFGRNVAVSADDINGIARFVADNDIGNTVVGPEVFLVNGGVDQLNSNGYAAFGPRENAAIIEVSKVWSAGFMDRNGIPSPEHVDFSDPEAAKVFIRAFYSKSIPQSYKWKGIVGKLDELAGGKGVELPRTLEEAMAMVDRMMVDKVYGKNTGKRILVQERLEGPEVSVMALVDGKRFVPLLPARDYKKVNDGEGPEGSGPNTGGMASFAPVELNPELLRVIYTDILKKTVNGMRNEGREFKGVLYAGIMLTKAGPKVLEFNCRFGDPELQAILALLVSDLGDIVVLTEEGKLNKNQVRFRQGVATAYEVVASGGYPGHYVKDKEIEDYEIDEPDVQFIHAGTRRNKNGKLVTDGGRVGGILAVAQTVEEAFAKADSRIGKGKGVYFEGMHHRSKFL